MTLFCIFLCCHCTTTTSNFLISRFVEGVNTRQRLSFPFPELRYSPLESNSRKICQDWTNWTRWNKRDEVWSSDVFVAVDVPRRTLLRLRYSENLLSVAYYLSLSLFLAKNYFCGRYYRRVVIFSGGGGGGLIYRDLPTLLSGELVMAWDESPGIAWKPHINGHL